MYVLAAVVIGTVALDIFNRSSARVAEDAAADPPQTPAQFLYYLQVLAGVFFVTALLLGGYEFSQRGLGGDTMLMATGLALMGLSKVNEWAGNPLLASQTEWIPYVFGLVLVFVGSFRFNSAPAAWVLTGAFYAAGAQIALSHDCADDSSRRVVWVLYFAGILGVVGGLVQEAVGAENGWKSVVGRVNSAFKSP